MMQPPTDLRPGSGKLEHYKYWTPGLRPYNTKSSVLQAIELKQRVYRKDREMDKTEVFNYDNNQFEGV